MRSPPNTRLVITHLTGRVARMDIAGPTVELDVGGVRYEVYVPIFLWPELPVVEEGGGPGTELGLHIYYSASANQPVPVLVGFLRRAERDFFRKFVTVEGMGPTRAAKAMVISVSAIARAIEQEDRPTLTRLPGVGARAADKIIAALRGKVVAEAAMHDGGIDRPVDARVIEEGRLAGDAVEAIVALGFPRPEARRRVEEARAADPSLATVEDLTLAVLRAIGAA
jgi:Holliday junction DNA helicase RuvA